MVLYATAIGLAFVDPAISDAIYAGVALMWLSLTAASSAGSPAVRLGPESPIHQRRPPCRCVRGASGGSHGAGVRNQRYDSYLWRIGIFAASGRRNPFGR